MKLKLTTLLPFLFCVFMIHAQEEAQETLTNSLEDQFVDVVDNSNNYQDYKVIKKTKINKLRENIMDSIAALETEIQTSETSLDQQKNKIASLTQELAKTQEDLALSRKKENGIELFGMLTEKSTYNTIMWSIILILLLALGFFIYKYKNSNSVTKEAQLKLAETEIEFEEHRQKAIEQQQQLRRKLQDEINKNRKSKS
ncbi:tRNA (guanine-N1)-methyltransferase [Altibacter sp.]|uniref:tRNA (guanine-N1)-methyltransferase n=1 Tax=Altibacter sp. TaxID=2024823 RepID=UPI0025B8A334|nr:tRNA (guanine-N1)-methyltransferase [Altibacter sp.]|tara:strand:- start:23 stop:619 length:597 start_codon:yes stop_codon:yes gene_type:complete